MPYILPKGGDITTKPGASAKNIQNRLNEILLDFRRNGVPFSNIKVQDIQEVVQIVDLDGTFIPNASIVKSASSSFVYDDEMIQTSNVDGAVGRNKKKAEILRKLVEVKQVSNVPYSVYYVSCDMDHLLFGKRNILPNQKKGYSIRFQMDCERNPGCLKNSIFNPEIMAGGSYEDSWEFIQQGTLSLKRYTNLNIFFSDYAKNPK